MKSFIYSAVAQDGKKGTHSGSVDAIDLKDAEAKVKAMFSYPVTISVGSTVNWEVISDEHDMSPTDIPYGQVDLQVEQTNAYHSWESSGKYKPK